VLNGGTTETTFTMPTIEGDGIWAELVDTARRELRVISSGSVKLDPYSMILLRYGENRRMTDSADPTNVSGSITHRNEHG
jgi:hypothetical protein